jgi:hypothetical protein
MSLRRCAVAVALFAAGGAGCSFFTPREPEGPGGATGPQVCESARVDPETLFTTDLVCALQADSARGQSNYERLLFEGGFRFDMDPSDAAAGSIGDPSWERTADISYTSGMLNAAESLRVTIVQVDRLGLQGENTDSLQVTYHVRFKQEGKDAQDYNGVADVGLQKDGQTWSIRAWRDARSAGSSQALGRLKRLNFDAP